MQHSVQINLQDSNGTVYDIDHLDASGVPTEVVKRNAKLESDNSAYRWRINGESEEFDNREKFARVISLYKQLLQTCSSLDISILCIVPVRHQYGEMWEILSTEVKIPGKTPHLFDMIRDIVTKTDVSFMQLKRIFEERLEETLNEKFEELRKEYDPDPDTDF